MPWMKNGGQPPTSASQVRPHGLATNMYLYTQSNPAQLCQAIDWCASTIQSGGMVGQRPVAALSAVVRGRWHHGMPPCGLCPNPDRSTTPRINLRTLGSVLFRSRVRNPSARPSLGSRFIVCRRKNPGRMLTDLAAKSSGTGRLPPNGSTLSGADHCCWPTKRGKNSRHRERCRRFAYAGSCAITVFF